MKTIEAALQELILDDEDLERLESGLNEVNFFEAVGAVKSELRHSDFLAYLLDPQANHGLSDKFLKRLAQRASPASNSSTLSPLNFGVWDIQSSTVERESDNTDILIVDDTNKFVIVIENKIQSGEHDDQLEKYKKKIEARYPGYRFLFLYLSVDGDVPSHPDYIPLSYTTVCQIVEEILRNHQASLYPDVAVLLRHYRTLLRRHFMDDDELASLARSIYRKHKTALDYIFEKRPDFQLETKAILESLIQGSDELVSDYSSKTLIRFTTREWADDPLLRGEGWTPSGRMLLFEFRNLPVRVDLALIIGPGDIDVRKEIFEVARTNSTHFKVSGKTLYNMWNRIWVKRIVTAGDLESEDREAVRGRLAKFWEQFQSDELQNLRRTINEWRASTRLTPR